MSKNYILVHQAQPLQGTVSLAGAKNAALVIMASLILTNGTSHLFNIPNNADVACMIRLLKDLGAHISFDATKAHLIVDTSHITKYEAHAEMMTKMRASILILGPLLARFGKARVAFPGGDVIGKRPINYHLIGLQKLGVKVIEHYPTIKAWNQKSFHATTSIRIALEYPSVGATENLLMMSCLKPGETVIINGSFEPEVLDLVSVLNDMGACISIHQGNIFMIKGVNKLNPITYTIMPDRMEAGSLLLAAAASGGSIHIPNARANNMDVFLDKLQEMGHTLSLNTNPSKNNPQSLVGIKLKATQHPRGVSIKTGPYPGFPTDMQASFMAALCLAEGVSTIEETVYENRFIHAKELTKMGAQIAINGPTATIRGVEALYGCEVIANDIRASSALVTAGLMAQGKTKVFGLSHWYRGYDCLDRKLKSLGAQLQLKTTADNSTLNFCNTR